MTGKNIYQALGGLDPHLIWKAAPSEENKPSKKHKATLVKWGAIAACFVLVFSICILPIWDSPDSSAYRSVLALTVYAADGTEQSVVLDQSCLKSSISGKEAFGKDVPTFEFYVAPVKYGEEGDVFQKYDMEISYNGKVVEAEDEHIRLLYVVPQEGIYGIGRYGIIGWFDEPTDIIVTLKDKENGEIVEKMTVNVSYSKAAEAYQITWRDLYSARG